MKKIIALLLCCLMTLSVLAGCGGNGGSQISDDPNTLTIGLPQITTVEDYNTNAYTLWLEEVTGYNLEFYMFSTNPDDYRVQLSTMVAGGERLPDILWGLDLGQEVYTQYGDYGYLLDLTSYYQNQEKSATFWERVEAIPNETFRQYVKDNLAEKETGKIWAMPQIECSTVDAMDYQVYINQAWLDKLQLEMPTDPESLYQVLKAFVEKDPNGNGKKDERGIIGQNLTDMGSDSVSWLLNMFVNASNEYVWNVDENGKLYMPYTTDEYREGLKYIHKLVSEGLMPDTCWAMSHADMRSLLNPTDGVNTVGIWVGHPTVVLDESNNSFFEYTALPNWGYCVMNNGVLRKDSFITSSCSNPDAAWKLYMAMCSEEGSNRQYYGEKGTDWIDADPGTTSYIGWDADIKVLNFNAFGNGVKTWDMIRATVLVSPENETVQMSDDMDEWVLKKMEMVSQCYELYMAQREKKPEVRAPRIVYTLEESEATENERKNCSDLIHTSMASFCVGAEGMDPNDDAQWQNYLDELNKLGLQTWQDQAQGIYDEQTK